MGELGSLTEYLDEGDFIVHIYTRGLGSRGCSSLT